MNEVINYRDRSVEAGDFDVGDVFVVVPVEAWVEGAVSLEGAVYPDDAVFGK